MSLSRATTVLAALIGLASVWFGVSFLIDPHGSAAGFGVTPWPEGNAAAYFVVKAVRDIAAGALALLLLARGHRTTLGWAVLIETMVPLGDFTAVITHGGSIANGAVHLGAAVFMLTVAALLLREAPERRRTAPAPAA